MTSSAKITQHIFHFVLCCAQKTLLYNSDKPHLAAVLPKHQHTENLHAISLNIHMNKADIINKVHEALGGTKVDAEKAVETMIDGIVDSLKSGDEVSIAGLGIFSAKMRNARTARNPRTGETIEVPSMRVPKFRAAKALKDAVR
jgi:DNA-binding protein HU-beta